MSLSLTQISTPFSFLLFPITLYHYEQLLEFSFHQLLEVSNSLVPSPGISVQSQCSVLGYWRKSLKSFRFGPLKFNGLFKSFCQHHCSVIFCLSSSPPCIAFRSHVLNLYHPLETSCPVYSNFLSLPHLIGILQQMTEKVGIWGGNFLKHFSLLYKVLYSYPSLLSSLPFWGMWCSS